MYIDERHIIVIYIILILLFAIPLVLQISRIKLFQNFNFSNLVRVLNRSIILQLIIGVIITLISMYFDKVFYSDDRSGTIFTDIFIESTYCYIGIGCFFYLPAIGLINIIRIVINSLNRKRRNQ